MNTHTEIKNLTWKGSRERPIIMDVSWDDQKEKLPVVILAHGYKGFKDWGAWGLLGQELVNAGFLFIKFNFSFNGGTVDQPEDFPDLEAFGMNNYSTEVADISRVIDFVYKSNVVPREKLDLNELTLIGHSRGGGMAIISASNEKRISRLVTLASISDLSKRQPHGKALEDYKEKGVFYVKNGRTHQMMPHFFQMYEDYHKNKEVLDIQASAKKMSVPWLIIHGDKDFTVSISEARELKELQPKAELIELKGADHVFGAKHPWEENMLPLDLHKVSDLIKEFIAVK